MCRPSRLSMPRRARKNAGVRAPGSLPALRSPGWPPRALGPFLVPKGFLSFVSANSFPRPPASDTIPIVCSPAVPFNPVYPAGPRPRPWTPSAGGPPDKRSFVRRQSLELPRTSGYSDNVLERTCQWPYGRT